MIGTTGVVRDERTVVEENASYHLACNFMTFCLLLDAVYRSLVRHEETWDLLAIVILGGAVSLLYQWRRNILTAYSIKAIVFAFFAAALAAAMIALSRALR